jgi:hypothetical protein
MCHLTKRHYFCQAVTIIRTSLETLVNLPNMKLLNLMKAFRWLEVFDSHRLKNKATVTGTPRGSECACAWKWEETSRTPYAMPFVTYLFINFNVTQVTCKLIRKDECRPGLIVEVKCHKGETVTRVEICITFRVMQNLKKYLYRADILVLPLTTEQNKVGTEIQITLFRIWGFCCGAYEQFYL